MTYSHEEAEVAAETLIKKCLEAKTLNDEIKTLKAELLEYAEVENINEKIWPQDNGYVEIKTQTKYKLADIPCEPNIDATVVATDVAEKAFATKVYLTKEGKKMFNEKYPAIVNLMIAEEKRSVHVEI